MPDQHRQFFNELPFLLIGSTDADGQPWATMRLGRPGFLTTPDSRTLHIAGASLPGNPLQERLNTGAFIGALGIQLTTRRRNRVNGVITIADHEGLTVAVSQSFGNCPKYIQRREPCLIENNHHVTTDAAVTDVAQLGASDQTLIRRADTCFIASANLDPDASMARGVDVSHKGGRPGFLRVDDDHTLTMPDFMGNSYFNTIGNLMHDPRAGLLFIDFELGDLLYLAADAEIIWGGPEVNAFTGAERLGRFHIRKVRRTVNVLPIRWSPAQYAAELTRTGTWQEPTGT
ncbi:MAG TPA: pyridoxamine 5'-phosphate oxidase family protein [Burkholderiales bacterium]